MQNGQYRIYLYLRNVLLKLGEKRRAVGFYGSASFLFARTNGEKAYPTRMLQANILPFHKNIQFVKYVVFYII